MKINAHVLSVADRGDNLEITAASRPYCSVSVTVPMTEHARRAYYVGRRFTVTLKPN
jgi:hypothetical protein